ncbi:MAG: GNAT family N-acetyltransferase [Dysgonomonas sp.]|nr:GNAT family N-acetyltransferase [Dysgonomonas sp.]
MLEYLEWDSSFFKRKIGRINLANESKYEILSPLLYTARQEGYDLVYCIGKDDFFINENLLEEYNGTLVDQKVIFSGSTLDENMLSPLVEEYTDTSANENLIELTLLSGKYSRFRLDQHFTKEEFEHFYTIWLNNSLNRTIADKIFVCRKDGSIVGFVTVKKEKGYGQIGLIAVDNNIQGLGLGKQLVSSVKKYLNDEAIDRLEVVTQLKNENACHFYRKCKLSEKTINNIYHFWI